MSKLTEKLKNIGLHNEWEFAGHGNVYISYTSGDSGRGGHSPYFSVVRPGFKTDANAHWKHQGTKTVTCRRSDKDQVLAELKAWAGKRYNITEWARTPFGGWMDAGFVARRMEELNTKIAAIEATGQVINDLPVYGGSMFLHGNKQRHVIMAGTKARFMLATGISNDYVGGPTGNELELKVARAKPGALFVNIGGDWKNDRKYVEVPEAEWHWAWRDHLAKRARSITRAQFILLRQIIVDKVQPTDPAKAQPLVDFALIVATPLGGFVGTERGKLIVANATEKPRVDLEAVEKEAQINSARAKRETDYARKKEIDDAKDDEREGYLQRDHIYFGMEEGVGAIFIQQAGNRCHGLFPVPRQDFLHRAFF